LDVVAALVDVRLGDVEPLQLVQDRLDHVALEALERVVRLVLDALGRLGRQVAVRLRIELGHLPDHVLVAELGDAVVARFFLAVEAARVLDAAGEVGALLGGELLHRLAEERLGGRPDAVGAAAEVDGVEVLLQDRLLGEHLVQLDRDEDLLDLPLDRALLGEAVVVAAGHLLGDRGGALHLLAADRAPQGADHAAEGDAGVLPEGVVLGGDDGVLYGSRHLVVLDRDALGAEPGQFDAVPVDDDALLVRHAFLDLVFPGDRGEGVRDHDHAEHAAGQHHEGGQDELPARQEPAPPRLVTAALRRARRRSARPAGAAAGPAGAPGRVAGDRLLVAVRASLLLGSPAARPGRTPAAGGAGLDRLGLLRPRLAGV